MAKLVSRTKDMLEELNRLEETTSKALDIDAFMALDEKTLSLLQNSVTLLRAYSEKEQAQAEMIESINEKLDKLLAKKN